MSRFIPLDIIVPKRGPRSGDFAVQTTVVNVVYVEQVTPTERGCLVVVGGREFEVADSFKNIHESLQRPRRDRKQ